MGIRFGDALPNNPIFSQVTMPHGWKLQPTDHPMHTSIVDSAGNRRGSFFYKTYIVVREAHLYDPEIRYSVKRYFDDQDYANVYERDKHVRFQVIDSVGGVVLWSSAQTVQSPAPTPAPADGMRGPVHEKWWLEFGACEKTCCAACREWLDKNFPEHKNPSAYWPA